MRLINADSIMREMADLLNASGNPKLAEKAIALIDHEPTAFDVDLAIEDIEDCIAMADGYGDAIAAYRCAIDQVKGRISDHDAGYQKDEARKLMRGYAALEHYGWYFEPEEKMILDGTHELYTEVKEP